MSAINIACVSEKAMRVVCLTVNMIDMSNDVENYLVELTKNCQIM